MQARSDCQVRTPVFERCLTIDDAGDIYQLSSLVATALIGGGLTLYAQGQAAQAYRQAYEQAKLYELSQRLSSELDVKQIAQAVVETTWSLLPCDSCALSIESDQKSASIQIVIGNRRERIPTFEEPICVRANKFGTLGVMLKQRPGILDDSYQRLVRAIAAQAGLALERRQLIHQLAHTEALAESDRLKSTLLSAVSHDLRTPLAAIVAAADELLADDITWTAEAACEYAYLIRAKAQHLDTLVTNMLDLTRIEAGVLQPRRSWYHVAEIVYRVLDRLETELRGRMVDVDVPDDLPLVPIDYIQIEQVLWNLIQNAIKYSPAEGSLLIQVTLCHDMLQLQIGDRGPGIPSDARNLVFEKFARLSVHERLGIPGAGVGLTICKGIIEAHQGQITLSDREGGGALVTMCLPLIITPKPAIHEV